MTNENRAGTWVIHADLDAFFAAVAILRQPELAGKPVIVGGSPDGRGVVSSASYEARAFGVRSAMPAATAARLCPEGIFVKVPGEAIREYAERFREILYEFSPVVEIVSVDEAYLDASDSERLFGGAVELARQLKDKVLQETGLVVSLGIASNRLVAKIASDLDKPDGFRVVAHGEEAATFAPLPIERLPGIGPKTSAALRKIGIRTLGELAGAPESALHSVAGRHADSLRKRARGESSKPVASDRGPQKTLGHERTFSRDLRGMAELRVPLFGLCERTGAELRRRSMVAGVVALKLRYDDFTTVSRQRALPEPTDAHQDIFNAASGLLAAALAERSSPVRLIGVRVAGMTEYAMQLDLFTQNRVKTQHLNRALDALADRHGHGILRPASVGVDRGELDTLNGRTPLERR